MKTVINRDNIVNKEAKINYQGKIYTGLIKGRCLDYPLLWVKLLDLDFEIPWELADKAVNRGFIIGGTLEILDLVTKVATCKDINNSNISL